MNLSYTIPEKWSDCVGGEVSRSAPARQPTVFRGLWLAQRDSDFGESFGGEDGSGYVLRLPQTPAPIPVVVVSNTSLPSNSGPLPTRHRRLSQAMAPYCFSSRLPSLSPQQRALLQATYAEYGGKLPSRKELKELSAHLGLPQTRIRQWFLDPPPNGSGDPLLTTPLGGPQTQDQPRQKQWNTEVNARLDSMERRLIALESEMQKADMLLQSMSPSDPAYPFLPNII